MQLVELAHDLNGQMSNLVLIRTSQLRDSTDSDVRKLLRKMLILECVRNKDRSGSETNSATYEA